VLDDAALSDLFETRVESVAVDGDRLFRVRAP
jgi:hypothetical protein